MPYHFEYCKYTCSVQCQQMPSGLYRTLAVQHKFVISNLGTEIAGIFMGGVRMAEGWEVSIYFTFCFYILSQLQPACSYQNTVVLEAVLFNTLRILRMSPLWRKKAFSHTCQSVKLTGDFPVRYLHIFHRALSCSGFYLAALFTSHTASLYPEERDCFHRKVAKVIDLLFLANKGNGIHSTQQTRSAKQTEFAVTSGMASHLV